MSSVVESPKCTGGKEWRLICVWLDKKDLDTDSARVMR